MRVPSLIYLGQFDVYSSLRQSTLHVDPVIKISTMLPKL